MYTERLGWTLVHFLWQGAAIAALYWAVKSSVRSLRAGGRYLLACAALVAMMAAPVVTWVASGPADATVAAADRTAIVPGRVAPAAASVVPVSAPTPHQNLWLQWAVAIWILGATALSLRLLGGWTMAARMRWKRTRPAPLEWCDAVRRLSAGLGVTRAVSLRVSAMVQSPVVIGAWRPLVLVPVGMLTGMPAVQMEALLLHELAHIRRHDYLVNLLQSIAEALLFYHPAVWWVSGHIRAERERCCDDAAVAVSGNVLEYVNALAELAAARPARLAAVAANGGSVADRIARLLGAPRPVGTARSAILAVVLLAGVSYGVFAQTTPRPEFQVASVKLNVVNPPRRMFRPQAGGRLITENAPLQLLIQNAYSVQAYQVVGGPAWVGTDGYDIEAKPERETSTADMRLMLQSLLADRFKLELHLDTRQLPVYYLGPVKGSFDPPPAKDDTCKATQPGELPPPGTFPCGRVGINGSPSGMQMNGRKAPMAEFDRVLAAIMGHPVIDHTAFAGEFDLHLTFAPDESLEGLPPGPPGVSFPPPDPTKPTIFSALQEQLGLKLSAGKGPVEVLVIDHVERPTAN